MRKIIPFLLPIEYGIIGALFVVSALHITELVISPFTAYGHPLKFMAMCLLICAVCLLLIILSVIYNYKLIAENLKPEDNFKDYKFLITIEIIESAIFFFAFAPALIAVFKSITPYFFN